MMVAATSAVRRAGFESMIRSHSDFQLAGSTASTARLASSMRSADPDILVVDSDSARDLPETVAASIVLLTEISDARTISRLLKAGVRAILPRESDPDEIISAIHAAYGGLVLLSSQAAESLAAVYGDHEPELDDELTEEITARETEVLQMLAEGLVNKDIAARLGISEHTVKFHISSILDKLDASTRTEAVTVGIRRGLLLI